MEIFKFGGASVKDANGVKNLANILEKTIPSKKVIVISAMGKTTNAMERIISSYFENPTSITNALQETINYHITIAKELFSEGHLVFEKIRTLFEELKGFLAWNKSPKYDFVYDQVVGYGELVSTTIVSYYLNERGIKNEWVDARDLIKTNNNYRDARVDWDSTQEAIKSNIDVNNLYITQGFIASDSNNFTTTLGREGSDYTGGIFAYCLDADSLTIWKDVPGVLNGDPRVFENTELLLQIPYEEAIELAFYGASVIHPKTLQPLQRKEISLFVKSFLNPTDIGTVVKNVTQLTPLVPCYIVKKEQVLISLSSLDFSFMMEDNIGEVFKLLAKFKMKVDLIQNSAISFSVCVDNKFNHLEELILQLKAKFRVNVTTGVSLYTIRHSTPEILESFQKGKNILLKQVGENTVQLVATL